jgi:hypothetical protein
MDLTSELWRVGKYLSVDLPTLIERVYVAPQSSDWLLELVESLVVKYELEVPVVRSTLGTDPVY